MKSSKNKSETDTNPIKKQKQPWWRWLITILAIGLFFYIIYKNKEELQNTLAHASMGYFLIGLGLLFLSRQFVSARWFILLKIAKRPFNYWDSLKLTYTGLFAANFLFSSIGGDLIRFIGTVQYGFDSALVLASLIMDRIIGMTGMLLLLPSGLFLLNRPYDISSEIAASNVRFEGILVFLGKFWKKSTNFVKKLIDNVIFWLKHPKNLFYSFVFTLLHETLIFGMVWFFIKSLGGDLPFWVTASLYSLNYLVTSIIPLSIGGLGIQEMAVSFVYSHYGGLPNQTAILLAAFIRIAVIINSLPGAIFLPSILRQNRKERTG